MPELTSWKEIASHLGVGVRTAQTWERERGLPIHRLPGGNRVLAFPEELDAWKTSAARAPVVGEFHARFWLLAIGLALIGAAGLLAGRLILREPVPRSWRAEGQALVVEGVTGAEAWRHVFSEPLSARRYTDAFSRRQGWIEDLDGDGRLETLFVQHTENRAAINSAVLNCFESNGRLRWRFVANREVATATDKFTSSYRVATFAVVQLRDGQKGVLVSSIHSIYYPAHVALLNPSGGVVREYWHPGHLGSIAVTDLDSDGRQEAILGGVNNARNAATIVVLDPDRFGGGAYEPHSKYHFIGLTEPIERARVLFPRSCLNLGSETYNVVHDLWVEGSDLVAHVKERLVESDMIIMYRFGPKLETKQIGTSDQFDRWHMESQQRGDVGHGLAEEIGRLRASIVPLTPQERGMPKEKRSAE